MKREIRRKKGGRSGMGRGFIGYLFFLDLLPFSVLTFCFFHFLFFRTFISKMTILVTYVAFESDFFIV